MKPEQLAHLHGLAFEGQGRGWSKDEFARLLQAPEVFLVGNARGIALVRAVADEAEILTLACVPDHRRKGIGLALVANLENTAKARGVGRIFLEVSSENAAGIRLYDKSGYSEVGRRTGYYTLVDGTKADAIVMEKRLV